MSACLVPLMGREFLAKVGTSTSFAPPIYLTPASPVASLLLLLASQPPNPNVSFPLPASQVDPQVWDTQHPSVAKHHSPIVIELQDSTKYITQAQYLLSLEP